MNKYFVRDGSHFFQGGRIDAYGGDWVQGKLGAKKFYTKESAERVVARLNRWAKRCGYLRDRAHVVVAK